MHRPVGSPTWPMAVDRRARSRSSGCRSRGCARPRRCAARATTAASSRSAPSTTCPTTGRRSRRSCSRDRTSPTTSCCASRAVDDLDARLAARCPGDRARRGRPRGRRSTTASAVGVRRPGHRDRLDAAPPPGPARISTASSRCARSTTRSALRAQLDASPKVVVIGAGFIGAEVAATCRGRGLDVTVLEGIAAADGARPRSRARRRDRRRAPRPRRRPAHERDVDAHRGRRPRRARPPRRRHHGRGRRRRRGCRRRARNALARRLRPHARRRRRVRRDRCSPRRASSPRATSRGGPNPLFDGEFMRLEHWTNATEQGVHVAQRGCSPATRDRRRSRRCRSCGRTSTTARSRRVGIVVGRRARARRARHARRPPVRGAVRRGDRIVGALGFNRPRQVMQYRRLIARARARGTDALATHARTRERRPSAMTRHAVPNGLLHRCDFVARRACGLCVLHRARDADAGHPALRRGRARRGQGRGRRRASARSRSARSCCARTPAASATGSAGGS